MNRRNIIAIYGIISFVSVCLFLIILFPNDKIKNHIVYNFEKTFPGYTLEAGRARPALLLALRLSDIKINRAGEKELEADYAKIGYPILSLFSPDRQFLIKVGAYDGTLKGKIKLTENKTNKGTSAEFNISHISIKDFPMIKKASKGNLAGFLNGKINYDSAKPSEQAIANLQLADCEFPLSLSKIDLGKIIFSEISLEAALTMQNLSLKKCILKGKQLNGEISGVISIKEPVMQSELNLSVTVQPQNDFLKNMPSGLIFGNLSGKNGFSFKVIGTIEKPDVSMAGSTAPSPQPSPARGEGFFSPP